MTTLLLRLEGPLQAWGTQSRFRERDTGLEPSKSGVIGLLCAALGRPRDASVADLAALRLGVRVDREGVVGMDFHTAGANYPEVNARGKLTGRRTTGILSRRYYLADASFLVGLEGERALLERLNAALERPRWQLFLGRRAFAPSQPIRLPDEPPLGPGLRDESMEELFRAYWPDDPAGRQRQTGQEVRVVMDAEPSAGGQVRTDLPISFAHRQFAVRHVRTDWIAVP